MSAGHLGSKRNGSGWMASSFWNQGTFTLKGGSIFWQGMKPQRPWLRKGHQILVEPFIFHLMQRTLRIAALLFLTVAALSSCGTIYQQCAAYAEAPSAEVDYTR